MPEIKYSHYEEWECYQAGMYKGYDIKIEQELIELALEFMSDVDLWGAVMREVTEMWPISCAQHLGSKAKNRKAWIGQASVCLATGICEKITRKAWWFLPVEKQKKANAYAASAIEELENG